MTRARFIFRVTFFLLTIFLVVYLNTKTGANTETIVEFKLKMIDKIRADSLDSKQRLDLLVNETTKFVEDSSHLKNGIHYLTGLLGIWVVVELGFLILDKGTYGRQD